MADHIIGSAEGMSFFDRVNGLQKRAETAEERARFFEASQRRLHNALGKIVETCGGGSLLERNIIAIAQDAWRRPETPESENTGG